MAVYGNTLADNDTILNQNKNGDQCNDTNKDNNISNNKRDKYSWRENNSSWQQPPRVQRVLYDEVKFSVPSRYEIIKVLGKGSYGIVCSARDLASRDQSFTLAIKKIMNTFHKEILLKRAIRELKFMNYFRGHKNIVNLINVEIIVDKPFDGLYCYQELIEYDLAKVIHSSVTLSEFHIQYFLYQIVCGLKYIHSANVIHRDLKPGNILCTLYGCLKICDFGLARGIGVNNEATSNNTQSASQQNITNYVATRWYRAPELILSNKPYTKAIDIWSVGCILAEFYARKPIFMGKDSMHQVHEIIKVLGSPPRYLLMQFGSIRSWNVLNNTLTRIDPTPWNHIFPFASVEAVHLMTHLLQWDPTGRLIVDEIIEHPFLRAVRKVNDEPNCPHGSFDFTYEDQLDSMNKLRQHLIDEVISFRRQRQ